MRSILIFPRKAPLRCSVPAPGAPPRWLLGPVPCASTAFHRSAPSAPQPCSPPASPPPDPLPWLTPDLLLAHKPAT